VKKIKNQNIIKYRIKWTQGDDTWEPYENLSNCESTFSKFRQKNPHWEQLIEEDIKKFNLKNNPIIIPDTQDDSHNIKENETKETKETKENKTKAKDKKEEKNEKEEQEQEDNKEGKKTRK